MSEARTSLGSISNFVHDAQAYVKGQLQCPPVQEAFLWERYDVASAEQILTDIFNISVIGRLKIMHVPIHLRNYCPLTQLLELVHRGQNDSGAAFCRGATN